MIGPVSIINSAEIVPLTDMLDDQGILKLRPAADYDTISSDALRLWCHQNARYGLPTTELCCFLRTIMGKRSAIEIGAGSGDLCHHLGIRGTDNYQQTFPDVKMMYDATQQPTIDYPSWVERIDANDAVARYNPEVVIASWVTQWIDPNLPPPPEGGNMYGVREDEIVAAGITYVLIGNISVHAQKKIMREKHTTVRLSFLRSRSANQQLNRVWIWNP